MKPSNTKKNHKMQTPDSVNVFSLSQTPQYTPGFVSSPPPIPYTCSWVRVVCDNNMNKPHWLLRNKVFAIVWDRIRGLYFDAKLRISKKEKTPNDSIRGEMTTDIVFGSTDTQSSVYSILYKDQCRALSDFIESMANDGTMTNKQLEFVQKRLLGGLNDRAKAALVVRALYGNKNDQFGLDGN
jgi:hypothetical protein